MADLEGAKGAQDQGQPMGQKNIPVWKVLMCVVWQSADGDIADESEGHFGFNRILAIRLWFSITCLGSHFIFLAKI